MSSESGTIVFLPFLIKGVVGPQYFVTVRDYLVVLDSLLIDGSTSGGGVGGSTIKTVLIIKSRGVILRKKSRGNKGDRIFRVVVENLVYVIRLMYGTID